DGARVGDVRVIEDLLEGYEAAANTVDRCAGEVYNIGGGRTNAISLLDLLDYLGKKRGCPIAVTKKDGRPGDQRCFISDNRKARCELNWTAKTHWTRGLDQLHDWL